MISQSTRCSGLTTGAVTNKIVPRLEFKKKMTTMCFRFLRLTMFEAAVSWVC